jgi:hypothetical protein
MVIALFIVLMTGGVNSVLAEDSANSSPTATEPTQVDGEDQGEPTPTEVPTELPVPTEVPTEEPVPTDVPSTDVTETPGDSTPEATVSPTGEPEAGAQQIQTLAEETSDVVITVRSSLPSVANTLPAGAAWMITAGGVTIDVGIFSSGELTLPYALQVTEPVPYGPITFNVNAGLNFLPFSIPLTVDEPAESFTATLTPVTESNVSVTVRSSNPGIASVLPASATWTVTKDGALVDSDTFASDDLALPTTIPVTARVPYGTYTVSVDGGPTFAPFSTTLVVDSPTRSFTIDLTPVTVSSVTINVSSADPTAGSTLPASATWSVSQGGVVLASDTFAAGHLALPQSIAVEGAVPFGTYQVTVNAGPRFMPFAASFTVNSTSEAFNITLIPNDDALIQEIIAVLIAVLTEILSGQVE